ncbi:hypothetical protein BU17DRAFT_103279 [Hysterangium stoloniferum]|nr:hypothetical protein BU17DRAFT_103279 [Hysterangium stoloniferum]
MTINKSQGQSLKLVGLDLRSPVFSHGQFYVHVFQMFPFLENTHKSFVSCRHFVRGVINRHETRPLRHLKSSQLAYETSNANSRIVREDGAELRTAQPAGDELASNSPRSGYRDIDKAETGGDLEWKRTPLLPTALQRRDQNLVLTASRDSLVPTPMIRTLSHPDMAQLCQDWVQGHANQTTTYIWSTSNPSTP